MTPWASRSKRASLALMLAMIVLVWPAAAHDPDGPTSTHPLVGAWVLYLGDTFAVDDPASGLTIHADGTVRDDGGAHGPGNGAWAATEEDGADVTVRYPGIFDGVIGALVVRAHVTVHPLGDKLFGEYTVQTPRGDGADVERGPVDLMGFRSDVEPMGPDPVPPRTEAALEP